jgi:DNA-binding CsgD family transcriptional regulator
MASVFYGIHRESTVALISSITPMIMSFPGHLYAKDLEGKFIFCNKNQASSAGMSEDSLIGNTDHNMPWGNEANFLREADQLVIKQKKPIIIKEVSTLSNGQLTRFLSHKEPLYESSRLIGIIGTSIPFEPHMTLKNKKTNYFDTRNQKQMTLTTKQLPCLHYLLQGLTAKEIARQLKLSYRTVQHHIESIKLNNEFKSTKEMLLYIEQT